MASIWREGRIHDAAQRAGKPVLALFFEVIYEEVVDFFSRGDKEDLVSFGKPLGPQVVRGTGNGRCDLTGFNIVDFDVKLVVVLAAIGNLAAVR